MYYENLLVNILTVYYQIYFLVDFIIYFVIFTCLSREVFFARYGHKQNINILCYSLGLIFSIYLVLWEFESGIQLFKFGPVLLAMLFLYLFIKFKFMVKERTELLFAYFVFIFLIAFAIFVFAPNKILPGHKYLLLSVAGVSIVFIIYLMPHMQGKSGW